MNNCIYVIQGKGTNRYKIGFTNDLHSRKKALQNGSPVDLDILLVHYTDAHEELERALHRYFESERIYGEWFSLTPEAILYLRQDTARIMEDLGVSAEWKKIEDNPPSLHDLFPSRREDLKQVEEIDKTEDVEEEEKTHKAISLERERRYESEVEPGDGARFGSSRYTAVEKLSAETAREIEGVLGTEKHEAEWSQALLDYADALDTYTGEYTYYIILK